MLENKTPVKKVKKRLNNKSASKVKHLKFTKALIKHNGDRVKAYQEIYPKATEASANVKSSIILSSKYIKDHLSEQLDKQNLGLNRLNKELSGIIKRPTKQILDKRGELKEVEDNHLKLDAVKFGYKLHKVSENKVDIKVDNRSINFLQSPDATKKLDTVVNKMEDICSKLDLEKDITGEIIDIEANNEE